MRRLAICGVCCVTIVLGSCKGRLDEHVTAVENGPFKILIRSQEFYHSGTVNIDICVAQTSSRKFPRRGSCFLHGFDFDNLSAKWQSADVIQISFGCGYVTHFANDAVVYPKTDVPVAFHAILRENCGYTGAKTCEAAARNYQPEAMPFEQACAKPTTRPNGTIPNEF
jgi:hypothetical protein